MQIESSLDLQADALYLRLAHGQVARTVELDSGTLVDVDAGGAPLGIEVLHPSREWPIEAFISQFRIDGADAETLRLYARGFHTPLPSFGRLESVRTGASMRSVAALA
jgi:uncharacterized protein YuzE